MALGMVLASSFFGFAVNTHVVLAASCDRSTVALTSKIEKPEVFTDESFRIYEKVIFNNPADCNSIGWYLGINLNIGLPASEAPSGDRAFPNNITLTKRFQGQPVKDTTGTVIGYEVKTTVSVLSLISENQFYLQHKVPDVLNSYLAKTPAGTSGANIQFYMDPGDATRGTLLGTAQAIKVLARNGQPDHAADSSFDQLGGDGSAVVSDGTYKVEDLHITISANNQYRIIPKEDLKINYTVDWTGTSKDSHPARGATINTNIAKFSKSRLLGIYAGINYADFKIDDCYAYVSKSTCQLNGSKPSGDDTAILPHAGVITVPWDAIYKDLRTPLPAKPSGQSLEDKGYVIFPILNLTSTLGNDDYAKSEKTLPILVKVYADEASRAASFASDNIPYKPGQQEAGQSVSVEAQGKNSTDTGGLTGLINDIVTNIAAFIIYWLYRLFSFLIAPIIVGALTIHPYQDSFVQVIYVGWQILRNVSNIFFIIALIVIGLATLLRASGYEFKHLLVELIMAALLVNFSLVIGQSLLAIADTVQSQFLPNNAQVVNSLAGKVMPVQIRDQVINSPTVFSGSVFGTAGVTLFLMAMAIGAFGVFAAIAVFLLIRIVALWILLMVSPLAFAANVLPATHHFNQEWWNQFIKYAFFTPIMAFFLNIAAIIADNSGSLLVNASKAVAPSDNNFVKLFVSVAANIILIIFLYAALKVAEDFGIYGAHAVTDIAKKGMFAPFKVGGAIALAPLAAVKGGAEMAAGYAGYKKTQLTSRWLDEKNGKKPGWGKKLAFMALNPGQVKKAFAERREERHHRIEAIAQGAATDIVHEIPGFKENTPSAREHAMVHAVDDAAKHNPYISERATFKLLSELMKSSPKDENNRINVWAQIKNLAEEKGMNYTLLNAKDLGFGKNYAASYDGFIEFMNDMEKKGWATTGEIGHFAPMLGQIAYKNREYWYAEAQWAHGAHTVLIKTDGVDEKTGKVKIAGQEIYDKITNEDEVEAEVERIVDSHRGDAGFDEASTRIKARSDVIKERIHHFAPDEHSHELYENYEAYVMGKGEIYSNYMKMQPQAKARDGHWSTEVELYETKDGVTRKKMSMLGVSHIATADSKDFAQGNQLQLKKSREFQAAFRQNEDVIKTDLVKELTGMMMEEAKEQGLKIAGNKKLKERIERDAERVAKIRYDMFEKYYVDGTKYEKGGYIKEPEVMKLLGEIEDNDVREKLKKQL